MRVLNRYRLELHWESVSYQDRVALLEGAYFSGPVLKEVEKLRENDQLTLDMTEQHKLLLPSYYQANLLWKQVVYKDDRILLPGARVVGKHVNSIDTLRNTDWILINCEKHDPKNHPYHLVYYAKVMRKEGEAKYGE